jgi:uncharacterized membrane protein
METFSLLEILHILGAMILFGSGIGIAFFMAVSNRTGNVALIAGTARIVVIADIALMATAFVLQPVTGLSLAHIAHLHIWQSWLAISLGLYGLIGLLWLPGFWLRLQMKDMAATALAAGTPLPPRYRQYLRLWYWCGTPGFIAIIAILYFMVTQPEYW